MKVKLFVFLVIAILASSCMTTKTPVGNFRSVLEEDNVETYTYAKGKQCYLFWGLIPIGRANIATPPNGLCEVQTKYGFFDAILSVITCGIFEVQTITVKAVEGQTRK